jgi:hypothetical protein
MSQRRCSFHFTSTLKLPLFTVILQDNFSSIDEIGRIIDNGVNDNNNKVLLYQACV